MNELPKVSLSAAELAAYEEHHRAVAAQAGMQSVTAAELAAYEAHQRTSAERTGVQAVEAELFPHETGTRAVEISLWVNGREVRATTDHETIQRIMAILVGIEP